MITIMEEGLGMMTLLLVVYNLTTVDIN